MKHSVFFLFALMLCTNAFAERTMVKGRIVEKDTGNAVEFANVIALDPRGRIAASCPSNEKGEFNMTLVPLMQYKICISYIGFKEKIISIRCKEEDMDLGRIALEVGNETINPAGITAKAIIRKESDRIVYDVQADPDSRRLNMDAFMSKIPGLGPSDRHGNLEYKGTELSSILIDDNVNFLINGKRQYPMAFIKAAYMSQLELILPGSPEYKNDKPILVIRLKEKLPYGFAGQLSGSGSSLNAYTASPDLVLNTPVMGIGLSYSYDWAKKPELTDKTHRELFSSDGTVLSTIDNEISRNEASSGHKISLDLSRKFLDEKLELNVSMHTSQDDQMSQTQTDAASVLSDGTESLYSTDSKISSTSPFRFNGGISARYKIQDSWDLSARYTMRDVSTHRINSLDNGMSLTEDVIDRHRQEHNASTSLSFRSKKTVNRRFGHVRAGYMHRSYDETDVYGRLSSTGGMEYTQGVAYLSGLMFQSFLRNRISASMSLNLEYVRNRGEEIGSGKSLDYDDFNIVPSAGIGVMIVRNHYLNMEYSMSTRRPDISQLNPYTDESDPFNVVKGNPGLKGEQTHSFSLNYTFDITLKWWDNFELSSRYALTPNAIEAISSTDVDNITTTSFQNIGRRNIVDIKARTAFKPLKNLSLDLNAIVQHNSYAIGKAESNSFWSYNLKQKLDLKLKWLSLSQEFLLHPFGLSAQSEFLKMNPVLNLSISKYWSKIHLGVSLHANDILHGKYSTAVTTAGTDFIQHLYRQIYGRNVNLRIYWRFGAFKQQSSVEHTSYDMQ